MKIGDRHHPSVAPRVPRNAAPIECDCGVHFGWAEGKGKTVTCPSCGAVEMFEHLAASAEAREQIIAAQKGAVTGE